MNEQEAIEYLQSGCLGLNCEYHIRNKCGDEYELREKRKEDAVNMAISALGKQIPKKPIIHRGTNRADCPTCNATVRGIKEPFGNWCSKCGQKLDWSE